MSTLAMITACASTANAKDLLLGKRGEVTLEAGAYNYETLQLGEDSIVTVNGNVSITADKLICERGCKIVYSQGRPPGEKVTLTLNAMDAQELKFLEVIGNGKDGQGFEPKNRARAGRAGRNARGPSLRHLRGRDSSRGGAASNGKPGGPGGNAMDVVLGLPGIKPGSEIRIEAIGGDGGRGQNGGLGGNGGRGTGVKTGSNGGRGGNGGAGGSGGDAGHINISLVVAPDEMKEQEKVLKNLKLVANVAGGVGGEGGTFGNGGAGGAHGSAVTGARRTANGEDGNEGVTGNRGKSPQEGERKQEFIVIKVTDTETYRRYLANLQLGR